LEDSSKGKFEKGYETQLRILEAARDVFAEKGFDGARTDEIAKRAGVNKALIYYYFDSKEKLLKAMIDNAKNEIRGLKKNLLGDIKKFDEENMATYFLGIFDYLEKSRDILRIISIEALKSSSTDSSIFSMLLPTYEETTEKLKKLGKNIGDQKALMLHSFFFNITPMIVFFTLGEKWASNYDITYEEAKLKYLEIFKKQYVSYFKEQYK
jgi:AcrR family transcriptional regulator